MNFQLVWQQIKQSIISKNTHNQPLIMWFDKTEFLSLEADPHDAGFIFRLSVPSALHQYWISQNLLETISAEISSVYSHPFHIELTVIKPDQKTDDVIVDTVEVAEPSSLAQKVSYNTSRETLNPEYTFSTFVVGRNNEFAHAVSYSIAKRPGAENYNPSLYMWADGHG